MKIGEMTNESGKAMLEELAGTPAADRALAEIAVERAIEKQGLSREDAERIYGSPDVGQKEKSKAN